MTGETGTGKELVARAIHHNSPRRDQRFVAINCSALPETLLEAELFGHVRGAFTGAVGPRVGRFEQAHKGTLFLDEIGTMSPNLQAKLLRVLQEREFERVGESLPTRIDVRVIAATNSDLGEMVREGTFREDLFYRVNVIPVRLPPLRERREDIPLLVQHFCDRIGRDLDPPRHGVSFSQQAVRQLMAYDWPGNVRQLENFVERAMTLSAGRQQIDVDTLPDEDPRRDRRPRRLRHAARRGLRPRRPHRRHRARPDRSVAGALRRQQAQGGRDPRAEAHHAGRKAEAPATLGHGQVAPKPAQNRRRSSHFSRAKADNGPMSRFLYWTIVLGTEPTSFRASEADELLPTLTQLRRKHPEALAALVPARTAVDVAGRRQGGARARAVRHARAGRRRGGRAASTSIRGRSTSTPRRRSGPSSRARFASAPRRVATRGAMATSRRRHRRPSKRLASRARGMRGPR